MKSGTCPKCGHKRVIRALAAEYSRDGYEHPMGITAEPRLIWPGRNPKYSYGVLYTYTCRSCGFTEWYAERPETIPIGEPYRTEILDL